MSKELKQKHCPAYHNGDTDQANGKTGQKGVETMTNPNFYAIVPAPVLYDSRLFLGAKLLYAIISQLIGEEGYCYATNGYFAKRLKYSPRTIRSWLKDLERLEHIYIDIDQTRAKRKESQRRIYSQYRGGSTLPPGGGSTLPPGGGSTLPPGGGSTLPPYKSKVLNINNTAHLKCAKCVSCFDFAQFWDAYGLKRDRAKCEKKYNHISEADREKIKEVLPGYVQKTHTDGTFPSRKYPSTWLNGACWNDEEEQTAITKYSELTDFTNLSAEEIYK